MPLIIRLAAPAALLLLCSPALAQSCCNHGFDAGAVPYAVPMPDFAAGPALTAPPAPAPVFAEAVAPPPGTLGRTYQLPSRPISIDEHPRTAKFEVRNAAQYRVVVEGPQKFKGLLGDDGIWRFESDIPLYPGIPQIYTVRLKHPPAEKGALPIDTGTFQMIRVIPGRVVFLSF